MKITLNLIDTVGYPKSAMRFVLFILSNQVHKMDCYILALWFSFDKQCDSNLQPCGCYNEHLPALIWAHLKLCCNYLLKP